LTVLEEREIHDHKGRFDGHGKLYQDLGNMRTDKAKNVAKVLKEVINDPFQTEREIAQKLGISN